MWDGQNLQIVVQGGLCLWIFLTFKEYIAIQELHIL